MMNNMEELMELDNNEMEQVNGGWTVCVLIGVSSEGRVKEYDVDAPAVIDCNYIGLGFGGKN